MRMYGYGNLLATMSLSNPRLTRNIFSQIMDKRVDSSSKNFKNLIDVYDKKNSETYAKKTSDEKVSDTVKKFAAQMTQTPLYTGKSAFEADYSAIGGLIQFMI